MSAKLPGFIPRELRQLARFVPLRGWDVIDWKPLLGSLKEVSWRYVSGNGVATLREETARQCPSIAYARSLRRADPLWASEQAASRRRHGDDILRLYFAQWLVDAGLFIDLRSSRFGIIDDHLTFAPSGLWIRLRPDFREGMVALYRSFYADDDAAFDDALRQMGMIKPGLSASAETQLKQLLFDHFGIDQREQRFSIDTFKASFDELFAFFIEHDYKLHSDFVWVGFYLITLYLTLEEGGAAHDTRSLCAGELLDA